MMTTVPTTLRSEAAQVPAVTVTLPGPGATCGDVQPAGTVNVVVATLPPFVAVNVHVNVFVLPAATLCVSGETLKLFAAATYGPTIGPPDPRGAAPAG
jgi:hypothetical protein